MLIVEQSNRLEALAARLADVLRGDPNPPLVPEIIAVPNQGMERWLSFELATRLGICASVDFPSVSEAAFDCFRRVGLEVKGKTEAGAQVTSWAIAAILGESLEEPVFAPVRGYVRPSGEGDPQSELRLHELSRRLATVFDDYVVYRPDWVLAWEDGKAALDADDAAAADEAWQAELWRRLLHRIPAAGRHLARLGGEFAAIMSNPSAAARAATLPRRISVFGAPALAPAMRELLRLLAKSVEIRIFLVNPTRHFWGDIRSRKEIIRDKSPLPPEEGPRLLASLGGHVRELHADFAETAHDEGFESPGWDTLLHGLQSDILEMYVPGGAERPAGRPADDRDRLEIRADDDSVRIHVCHGPMREVEVLHDQLLAMFEADPTLRPGDVVVLAPDVEIYAPAIHAVFGARDPAPAGAPPTLPFTVADRSLSAEHPIVSTFFDLLEIPGSRFEVDRILDLLECNALRRRVGLDDGSVDIAQRWIRETNVRWGADESTAARFGLPERRENTWRFGLDRLFLGYSLSGAEIWRPEGGAPILLFDGVEGGDAVVLGALSRLFAQLVEVDAEFTTEATAAGWSGRLAQLFLDLFAPEAEEDRAAMHLRRAIAALGTNAAAAGHDRPIGLDVIRSELAALLSTAGRSGQFLAGAITFASLLPMRNLPFRVVCLLGMNGDAFPRIERPQGFDLISRTTTRPGDRSRRNDDRYLFLEALLAARDRLHLSYVGRDDRENTEIPPSVVASELRDMILDGCTVGGAPVDDDFEAHERRRKSVLGRIEVIHPLQPFSRRYFEPQEDVVAEGRVPLFSYAKGMCDASSSADARLDGAATPPLVTGFLPAAGDQAGRRIDVADLVEFACHPTKHFLRNRLDIRLDESPVPATAREPLELDDLEKFWIRKALLDVLAENQPVEGLLAESIEQTVARLRARGELPPGAFGELRVEKLLRETEPVLREVLDLCGGVQPVTLQIDDLPVGEDRLTGVLESYSPRGGVVDFRPGAFRARDEVSVWIRHLVAAASGNGGESAMVGRDGEKAQVHHFRALDPGVASAHLAGIVDLLLLGRRIPLRFFPDVSLAFAKDGVIDREPGDEREGDLADPWTVYAFRDADPRVAPTAAGEPSFEDLARQIAGPLVEARYK